MKRPLPEIMRAIGIRSDLQPRELTIANTPAIEIDRTVNSIPLRQFLIVRGETAYIITAGPDTDAVIDDLLASIEFMKSVRIEAGGISMELPDGWRTMERDEAQVRATKVRDQTPLRSNGETAEASDLLIMMRNTAETRISPTIRATLVADPPNRGGESSREIAQHVAAATARASHGRCDDVHETKIAGREGAEWRMHYTLTETTGQTTEMFGHFVIVARKSDYYTIAFVGPAMDTRDAKVFEDVLQSVTIAEPSPSQ
jgi:hypothetical protein